MALGRGLDSLIEDSINLDLKNDQLVQLDLNLIRPDPNQPRKIFNEEKLYELSKSIENYGILEPIIVKKTDDYYMIIAGERRWRAAKQLGLEEIPAIIKENSNISIELSIIENLQREDLNIVDLAQGYEFLIKEFDYTHQELADKLGVTRSSVTNILRILNLSENVLEMLRNESLSFGKARTLLATKDKEVQDKLAKKIIGKNISVRNAENIVKKELNKSDKFFPIK